MATLTEAEYAEAQIRVAELAASKVPELTDPAGFERWVAAVLDIITLGGRTAAAMSVQAHLAGREAAGLQSRYTPQATGFVPTEQALASLQWAAGVLGVPGAEATPRSRAEGIVNRYVLQPARETTIVAATEDPVATRLARVPRPGACAFCLMLATRGAVYHDEQSAGRAANTRFVGEGEHKFHDHCHCTTRVVWEGEEYEPPAHVREAEDLYVAVTSGVEGPAKLAEFRRAISDRRANP
jgi:hypothetical protein